VNSWSRDKFHDLEGNERRVKGPGKPRDLVSYKEESLKNLDHHQQIGEIPI